MERIGHGDTESTESKCSTFQKEGFLAAKTPLGMTGLFRRWGCGCEEAALPG